MRYFFSVIILLPLLAVAQTDGFELYRSETVSTSGVQLVETEWRYSDESGQFVGLHRYQAAGVKTIATLLYLPGTNMNGVLKTTSSNNNLWLYLAERGVEVYSVDYRTRFIGHDFSGELAFMRDWSLDLFVEDAVLAAAKVHQQQPLVPMYIAGFSRGVSFAYALAGRVSAAGLVALDGSFKRQPYEPFDLGAALKRYDEEARYASVLSRRGYDARTEMMRRVIFDPASAAMDDRYQNAGDQLAETLFHAWGPGVLANTKLDLTPIEILARELQGYDWFYPTIQDVEGRSLASQEDDPNTSIDDHFGEMTIPVLYFGSTGFGAESLLSGIHSAARSGSSDVSIHVLEDYGHLDVLFARDAGKKVYGVIHQWILQHQAPVQTSE